MTGAVSLQVATEQGGAELEGPDLTGALKIKAGVPSAALGKVGSEVGLGRGLVEFCVNVGEAQESTPAKAYVLWANGIIVAACWGCGWHKEHRMANIHKLDK